MSRSIPYLDRVTGAHGEATVWPPMLSVLALSGYVLLSTILGRSFTALDPGNFDASLFMYIGERWLHGSIPYVEIWDNKPPGIFALIAAVFWQFPKSSVALAVTEGIFVIGCILTVYAIMRQAGSPWGPAALSAAIASAVCNLSFYNQHGTLTEIYLLWPATLSMLFFIRGIASERIRWIFLAGVCSGIASLFKPPGMAPLLAQSSLVLLLLLFGGLSLRVLLASMAANVTGVMVAWLPAIVYFWRYDAVTALFDAAFFYNLQYGAAKHSDSLSVLLNMITVLTPLTSLMIGGFILAIYISNQVFRTHRLPTVAIGSMSKPHYVAILAFFWTLFDLAGAVAGGRNYPHYFLTLGPSLSVTAGLIYWFLLDAPTKAVKTSLLPVALFAFILGPLPFEQILDLRKARLFVVNGPSAYEDREIAELLKARRSEGDKLFIWNYRPAIFLLSGMRSPSRLLDAHYLRDFAGARDEFGREIFVALERENPAFIVDGTREPEKRAASDPYYKKFRVFVDRQYELIHVTPKDGLQLYEIRRGKADL